MTTDAKNVTAKLKAMSQVNGQHGEKLGMLEEEILSLKRTGGLLSGRIAYLEGQRDTVAELLRGLCNAYVDLADTRRTTDETLGRIQRRITA